MAPSTMHAPGATDTASPSALLICRALPGLGNTPLEKNFRSVSLRHFAPTALSKRGYPQSSYSTSGELSNGNDSSMLFGRHAPPPSVFARSSSMVIDTLEPKPSYSSTTSTTRPVFFRPTVLTAMSTTSPRSQSRR